MVLLSTVLPAVTATAQETQAGASEVELPPREEIEQHKTYDPAPELQQTAGGSLIVNAFILEGPVRVQILRSDSGTVLMEKTEPSLFPFEVSRDDLGAEPTQVKVRIYVADELAHELRLRPDR